MKHTVIFLVFALLAACSQVAPPAENTAVLTPERLGTKRFDSGVAVAVNRKQNAVYMVGNTEGSLAGKNLGGIDTVLRRYERDGQLAWQRQFGSPADDYTAGVAVDENRGFVYVARQRGEPTVSFVYKYDSSGKQLWKHKIVADGDDALGVNAVTVDQRGDIYVTGDVGGGFDGGYVQKLDRNERVLWTRGTDNLDVVAYTSSLTTDSARNVYVSTVSVDDNRVQSFVTKFGPNGTPLPFRNAAFDDRSFDYVVISDLTVSGNSLYLVGRQGFDESNVGDNEDVFQEAIVVKLSLAGERTWARASSGYLSALSTDSSGNVFVTGDITQRGFDDSDAFLSSYDPQGRLQWTRRYASAQDDGGSDVVAYSSKELYLTGFTDGSIGGGKNRGGTDAFLRRTNGSGTPVWTDQ